jgi:hypothetical protein
LAVNSKLIFSQKKQKILESNELMKIETPKNITWPEITVLLGSAASMDKHTLLGEIPHFLYQQEKRERNNPLG